MTTLFAASPVSELWFRLLAAAMVIAPCCQHSGLAIDLSDEKYVSLPTNTVERHSVRDGDLLMARAIASQEHLGKSVVVYPRNPTGF